MEVYPFVRVVGRNKVRERLKECVNKIAKEIWPESGGKAYLDAGEEPLKGDIGIKSLELIRESRTCIFEVTASNPSVYSELGMALALFKAFGYDLEYRGEAF